MAKYRKKPVVIEAVQFDWDAGKGVPDIPGVKFKEWQDVDVPGFGVKAAPVIGSAYIETLEGPLKV